MVDAVFKTLSKGIYAWALPGGVRRIKGKMSFVYLLKSLKDGKRYVGSTDRMLQIRLNEHNSGKTKSTKHRRFFVLVGYQRCDTIQEAVKLEKKYKKSSGSLKRSIKKGLFTVVNDGV